MTSPKAASISATNKISANNISAWPPFILASGSPRRRELLAQIGAVPKLIINVDIDETPLPQELPQHCAVRLACAKAMAAQALHGDALILAADTIVACGRRFLPKAENAAEVMRCLQLLSGRRHRVYTAVAVAQAGTLRHKLTSNMVRFRRLNTHEISAYAESGDGFGKAGGYALQGAAAQFIDFISGTASGIIGLPLAETAQLLRQKMPPP